jgi:hypothetical protein
MLNRWLKLIAIVVSWWFNLWSLVLRNWLSFRLLSWQSRVYFSLCCRSLYDWSCLWWWLDLRWLTQWWRSLLRIYWWLLNFSWWLILLSHRRSLLLNCSFGLYLLLWSCLNFRSKFESKEHSWGFFIVLSHFTIVFIIILMIKQCYPLLVLMLSTCIEYFLWYTDTSNLYLFSTQTLH